MEYDSCKEQADPVRPGLVGLRSSRRARALAATASRAEGPATLDVDVSKPGVAIPAGFFGLMTEEINHSYDGGLFAELIQNRTFQDPAPRRAAEVRGRAGRRGHGSRGRGADPLVGRRPRQGDDRQDRPGERRPAGQPQARPRRGRIRRRE